MRIVAMLAVGLSLAGAGTARADDGYRLVHSFVDKLGTQPGTGGYAPLTPAVAQIIGGQWALYGSLVMGGTITADSCGPSGCGPAYPDCGSTGCGVFYRLAPPVAPDAHWTSSRIYVLRDQADGYFPTSRLVFDAAGHAYAINADPANGVNTIYRLTPPAAGQYFWTKTVLHALTPAEGQYPDSDLAIDRSGALYGTAPGTPFSSTPDGAVFRLSPPPAGKTAWAFSVLHRFTPAEGDYATSPLTRLADGRLVGFTPTAAFQLSPPASAGAAWSYRAIYTLGTSCGRAEFIADPLVPDAAGNLYGVSANGSLGECPALGYVFRLEPPASGTTWTRRILYGFSGKADGYEPHGPLLLDGSGRAYGVARFGTKTVGGKDMQTGGTVFRLTPQAAPARWRLDVLHAFDSNLTDALGGLLFDPAGNLIGTTEGGGAENLGSIYTILLPAP